MREGQFEGKLPGHDRAPHRVAKPHGGGEFLEENEADEGDGQPVPPPRERHHRRRLRKDADQQQDE
jgi:hypothetical protein